MRETPEIEKGEVGFSLTAEALYLSNNVTLVKLQKKDHKHKESEMFIHSVLPGFSKPPRSAHINHAEEEMQQVRLSLLLPQKNS